MDFKIQLPFDKDDVIYTVEHCKIEAYYVEGLEFNKTPKDLFGDISYDIKVNVERYSDGINSFKQSILLKDCFLSKEDLIKQLDS
ncbi:MAG: hypothetical protein AB8G11_09655 [Saprospiraceae bacterium]